MLIRFFTGMTTIPATVRRAAISAALLGGLHPGLLPAQSAPPLDPAAVRRVLVERVNDGTFRGIVTAWREGDTLQTASAGVTRRGGAAIDPSTRFQLGEAGSVFTAALLAHLVARGELSLDDLAQRFLPPPIRLPTRNGRAITLGDLAFHRSGLPDTRASTGRTATARLDQAIRRSPLRSDIGSQYAFSQLGIDILGLALARHLRMPLDAAIQSRILGPLGITDLALLPSRAVSGQGGAGQAATGHRVDGAAVASSTRVDAGWSGSIVDMARFAAAASDTISGPLASTFALMMRTRSSGPDPALPVALGWRVLPLDGRDIYWHDAQDAPGFSAYLAMDPARERAVAVLSNTSRAVDAVAGQLLLGKVPVIAAAPVRTTPAPRTSSPRSRRRGRR